MKNKEVAEIDLNELVSIERSHERLERELHNLKYYLNNASDKNIRNAKAVLAEIEKILNNDIRDVRKKFKSSIAKNEDEKRFLRMTKINSPDKKTIERMGKTLKVRSSVLSSAVKTSELKKGQRSQGNETKKS